MLRAQGSLQQYLPFCVAMGLMSLSDFCVTVVLQTCLPDFRSLQFPIPETGYILTSLLTKYLSHTQVLFAQDIKALFSWESIKM